MQVSWYKLCMWAVVRQSATLLWRPCCQVGLLGSEPTKCWFVKRRGHHKLHLSSWSPSLDLDSFVPSIFARGSEQQDRCQCLGPKPVKGRTTRGPPTQRQQRRQQQQGGRSCANQLYKNATLDTAQIQGQEQFHPAAAGYPKSAGLPKGYVSPVTAILDD